MCYTMYYMYSVLQYVSVCSVCYRMCTQCVLQCVTQCNTTLLQVSNVPKRGNYLNQSFMKLLNFRCFTSLSVQCTATRPMCSLFYFLFLSPPSPFCSSLSSLPVHSSLLFLFSPYTSSNLFPPSFPSIPSPLSRSGPCCQGSARLQWTFFNPFTPWPVSWGQL